jgi:hypothetical protein
MAANVAAFRELPLSDEAKKIILAGNAARLIPPA